MAIEVQNKQCKNNSKWKAKQRLENWSLCVSKLEKDNKGKTMKKYFKIELKIGVYYIAAWVG